MKTILLTGARTPATLDLARSLHENGHRVIGAESMAFPFSRRSKVFGSFYKVTAPNTSSKDFIRDLISIIISEKVDLIIPTCEEAFHVSLGKTQLSEYCEVLIDEPEKMQMLHSKFQFNTKAESLGFKVPKSFLVRSVNEALQILDLNNSNLPGSRVVLKPEYSRFASNTLILTRAEALEKVSELSLSTGAPWVIQEFIQGPEFCTYALALHGKLVTNVTYHHEFTAGRGAGICFQSIHHPAIENWVKSFVSKTQFHGQIAFDFIEMNSSELVVPLECNPRATSGLHLIAHHPEFIHSLTTLQSPQNLIQPELDTQGQIRLAMIAYGLVSIHSFARGLNWLKTFLFAREVIFSWSDPLPFFDQFYTFFKLTLEAKRQGMTPLEISTRDIEWNG